MISISEKEALQKVANFLEEWLNVTEDEARVSYNLPDKNIDGYISIRKIITHARFIFRNSSS